MPFISRLGGTSAKGFGFGGGGLFRHTITSNQKEVNLYDYLRDLYWLPWQPVELTISSGVYIWSDSTSTAALTLPDTMRGLVTITNNGYILGRGGNGGNVLAAGSNGGPAISNAAGNVTLINASGAFIGGGGGGGGGGAGENVSGGGGGAGGGTGGNAQTSGGAGGAPGQAGSNAAGATTRNNTLGQGGPNGGSGAGRNENDGLDSGSGGGGGGRIPTNTNGVNALIPNGNGADHPGGYGGGQNQNGGAYGYPYWQNTTTTAGSGRDVGAAGGGGGYGSSGGAGGGGSGGSGGAAITGTAVTLTNNGTILGSTA